MDKNKCPKCGGEMEEGYQHDSMKIFDWVTKRTKWVRGGKALGKRKLGVFDLSNIGFNVNEQIPITLYRCKSCGYLESYAK